MNSNENNENIEETKINYHSWSTLYGLGNISNYPGTLATLVSAPFLYTLKNILGLYYYTYALLIALPYAIYACEKSHSKLGDHPTIVLDEVIGLAMVLIFIRTSIIRFIISIVIFRVLDIIKPWPISTWENSKSSIGVVADDIMAGLIAVSITLLIY